MNDRILELMRQADYPAPEIALRAQRLAELIVEECADWVKSRTMSNELRTELKRHFGIK
jgi:hypothetical protein